MNPAGVNDKPILPVDGSLLQRIAQGPSRVLVGVSQFNDENQQNLRIQQAVNRYNGTVLPPYWRPSTAFKCSLFKGKSLNPFAADESGSSDDSRQKPESRYAFPGHFPTVLLGKTQMRPTKRQSILSRLRSNAAGLPVSRFLDDSAEKYSDLKPTRSVLEVLQDLSRKRIHGKDENDDSSKRRCKGLGGDLVSEGEIPFQPLFVSKLKNASLPKKDQMTQTLSDFKLNGTPRSASPSRDSKWELRKKLAQKNNEIFASLSSSINEAFFAKRKRAGNTTTLECEDKVSKKKKVEVLENACEDTSSTKIRREKPMRKEHGPRSPPTKDRLMNIYFDLQSNANIKQDVLQAMNNKSEPSQFQRSTPENCASTDPPTFKNDAISNSSSNEKLQFSITPNPAVPINEVTKPISSPISSIKGSDTTPFFNYSENKKTNEATPLTKSENEKVTSALQIAPAVNPITTSTFSFGLTQPEKSNTITSPTSTLTKESTESSPIKLNSANDVPTSPPSHFQFGQKSSTSSSPNKSFNFDVLKSSHSPSVNFNASVTPATPTIASTFNPSPKTSTGFTLGDGTLPRLGSPSSTFSFSPGKTGSSPISTSSNPINAATASSPSLSFSQPFQNVTASSEMPSSFTIKSSPIQKTLNTSPTFSFENAKSTTTATVVPSMFSLENPSSEKVSSWANPPPPISFGQSESTLKPFSFGAKVNSDNKKSPVKQETPVGKPNEGFSFGNTNMWSTGANDNKDKKNVVLSGDKPSNETPIFGNAQVKFGTDNTSSKAKEDNKSIPTFSSSNQVSSIFSKLGNVVNSNQESVSNTAAIEGTKKEQNQNVPVSQNEAPRQPVFGTSKPLNDSNIFAGGSSFSGISKTDTPNTSSPLFAQASATSGAFSFESNNKPTFQFGQSNVSVPKVGMEAKPFSFGAIPTVASSSTDSVKTNPVTTATSQSIFSFGTEKTKTDSPIFSFGNTATATKPFTFGNSGAPQNDTTAPTKSNSSETPNIQITTTPSFGPTPSNQGGIENKSSTPVASTAAASLFGATAMTSTTSATSTSMFGPATTAPSIFSATTSFGTTTLATSGFSFGATNSVLPTTTASSGFKSTFGATSSVVPSTASSGFSSAFPTAPPEFSGSFGISNATTTTSPPISFSGNFGATNPALPSTTTPAFGNPAFGPTTSAPPAYGSSTGFGTTTSAPPAFGNTTGFGATSSAPFGATTTTPSAFGSATTFGTSTSAPSAFGSTSSFGTTSTPSAFGNAGVFGTANSSPSPFGSSAAISTTSAPPAFGSATTFSSTTSAFGTSFGTATASPSYGSTMLGAAGTSNTVGTLFGSGNALGTNTTFANPGNTFSPSSSTPAFGSTGTGFGNNNATFGNSVTSPTFGNATSPAPFSGNTTQPFGNANSFGSNPSSATTNTFGNSAPTSTFGFGGTQAPSPPSFNFGSTPASSAQSNTSFNFGSGSTGGSASSSVFNFGSSSASNNAKPFCFGPNSSGFTQTPTPGSSGLSQPATPGSSGFQPNSPFTPVPFSLPGTFSIGSGTTQPRSRTASRFRRKT